MVTLETIRDLAKICEDARRRFQHASEANNIHLMPDNAERLNAEYHVAEAEYMRAQADLLKAKRQYSVGE